MEVKNLSKEELESIITECETELLTRDFPDHKNLPLFYACIQTILKKERVKTKPFNVFINVRSNKTLLLNTFNVFEEFLKQFPGILKQVELNAVYIFLLGMIMDKKNSRPKKEDSMVTTPQSFLAYASHLPSMFEDSFPGYIDSGLLPLVIKLIIKKREVQEEYENFIID